MIFSFLFKLIHQNFISDKGARGRKPVSHFSDKGGGGLANFVLWLTMRGGGVWTSYVNSPC